MTTGKSKADFPGAFIPFDIAVGPVPTVAIDSAPTSSICINDEWIPFVIGALKVLGRPETWDDTYDNSVIAASELASLIGGISEGCGTLVPAKMCISGTFEDLDYGWIPTPGADCDPSWVAGQGWLMCCDATPQGFLEITREFGVETVINDFGLHIDATAPFIYSYSVILVDGTDLVNIANSTGVPGTPVDINVTGLNQPATAIRITIIESLGGCAVNVKLTDWKICYTGAFPLSVGTPDTFSHEFNFAGGAQGWFIDSGHGSFTGTDFISSSDGSNNILRVDRDIDSPLQVTSIKCIYSVTDCKGGTSSLLRAFNGTTAVFGDTIADHDSVIDREVTLTTPFTGKTILTFSCDAYGSNPSVLKSVTISGIGSDPF